MIYTRKDLQNQLKGMSLRPTDSILIHSSMEAMGNIEGGADTVLDVLMDYFSQGLLLLPTHTWAQMGEEYRVFDPVQEDACVGILPNLFRKRPGVCRSLHPTHSMAAYGAGAEEYIAGEEENNTPCTPGGCYDRLKDINGRILLVGVTHARNTFIHGVEEVLNIPNRLTEKPVEFYTVMPDGSRKKIFMRRQSLRRPFMIRERPDRFRLAMQNVYCAMRGVSSRLPDISLHLIRNVLSQALRSRHPDGVILPAGLIFNRILKMP